MSVQMVKRCSSIFVIAIMPSVWLLRSWTRLYLSYDEGLQKLSNEVRISFA